ncbi:NAD(P)/FAD-dependent oxidoreductase [Nocardia cyriacigeorgica]|uniref:NAD(P)/FAD-dependent oxidoreductase n=1 Tax=Nocardia cyriacigeorgica TaxID=135487 RepID=UPI002453971B|nr:FAD-dependent oxidoreductase [Nocardia cyriacigeorgica]
MKPSGHIAIVGGSLAAATAANELRARGFQGTVTIYTEEDRAPYTRPPLSKDILEGKKAPESAYLYLADGIEVRLGVRAIALDPASRTLDLANGESVDYDGVIIATGARARSLAASAGGREFLLRSMDDAQALHEALESASTVAIAGAGPLGMEIASVCCALGRTVTVVDPVPPMQRQAGGYLATLIQQAAAEAGVRMIRADRLARVVDAGNGSTAIVAGNQRVAADVVITAAGECPNVEWLAGSGLEIDGGLVVDERLAAAPGVVAAGDVIVRRQGSRIVRTPLWTNALEQATVAAATLLDPQNASPYRERPYFWTEQFGLSIKVCGTIPPDQDPVVVAGDRSVGELVLQWWDGEVPVAAATVNHRMPIAKLRRLVGPHGAPPRSAPQRIEARS